MDKDNEARPQKADDDFLTKLFEAVMNNDNFFRDTVPSGAIVDTCLLPNGRWETAVELKVNDGFHAVQRYATREEAEVGHKDWVVRVSKENPSEETLISLEKDMFKNEPKWTAANN